MNRRLQLRGQRPPPGAILLAAMLFTLGETPNPSLATPREPTPLREVRVLIQEGAQRLRVESAAPISLRRTDGEELGQLSPASPADVRPKGKSTILIDGRLRVPETAILTTYNGEPIRLSHDRDGQWRQLGTYAGSLRVVTTESETLDVINHVDVEDYVAGVVAAEAWPTFHDQALRGQAIVARTFALYHMARDPRAAIDFAATQGAQVYRGVRSDAVGKRIDEATDFTRGVVLIHKNQGKDRLFCAYYSAACGGNSQPAAPFGPDSDVPPLRGNVPCEYCEIAPGDNYRWEPVRMPLATVHQRLVARYEEAKELGPIKSISVLDRTDTGRPLTLRFTGSNGESFELLAEKIRHTLGPNKIKSTDFQLRIDHKDVIFENGKGFGHGLGLCQWGMQGQAQQGKRAGEILKYYYPTARLVRVY